MTVGATLFLWDRAGVIALSQTIDAQTGANLTAMAEAAGDEAGDLAADQGVVTFAAACMSIFTVVYIVVLAVMFKRILIAVKVVREACKALAAMPLLVAQPLCTMTSLCLLYVWTAAVSMYLMSAGEFDPSTGTFVYAGGDCSEIDKADAVMKNLSMTTTAALLTLTFNQRMNSSATAAGPLKLVSDSLGSIDQLKGTECATVVAQTRCKKNVNVSSSDAFPIGSCVGDQGDTVKIDEEGYGAACDAAKATAKMLTGIAKGNKPGTIRWDAAAGEIKFNILAPYDEIGLDGKTTITPSLAQGTAHKLALPLRRCSDSGGCASWDLSGKVVDNANAVKGTFTLKTTDIYSNYNLTKVEAMRACNQASGNAEKALKKFNSTKRTAALKQGKSDLNEVVFTYEIKNVTIDNWKSFLPITLDGSTYSYFVLYHLFMFLWTQDFTVSSGYFVTVGAVASWYWKMDKKEVSGPIRKSYKRYVLYNVGTVCFGSLIIAIVQLIRILMNYYINQMKKLENNEAMKKIIALMQCIINCCMWCIEKVIGYLNKNAYIMAATHGHGFCTGAFKGFLLLMRNFMRVAAINMITPAIMFFGKFFICLTTFCITYWAATANAAELGLIDGPPILTLFIALVIGYGVGDCFMSVVEAAVDCIMLSFLHDSEVNNGKDKPYFMADSLQQAINVKNAVTPSN